MKKLKDEEFKAGSSSRKNRTEIESALRDDQKTLAKIKAVATVRADNHRNQLAEKQLLLYTLQNEIAQKITQLQTSAAVMSYAEICEIEQQAEEKLITAFAVLQNQSAKMEVTNEILQESLEDPEMSNEEEKRVTGLLMEAQNAIHSSGNVSYASPALISVSTPNKDLQLEQRLTNLKT